MEHRILELYSGIGGMHCACNVSNIQYSVAAAIDINTVANEVYKHNFPDVDLLNRNIQSLSALEISKLQVDTILMSPPCQPFTRNGKYLDESDPRTNSFIYLMEILNELNSIQYILLENVKGFECSSVRNIFIATLEKCGFRYQEFLVCPSTVGVPNSRLRYYCIARRGEPKWQLNTNEIILQRLPKDYGEPHSLRQFIELDKVEAKYSIPDKFLKRANILDICYQDSNRSCCFTKAYSHYVEGTGSVLTDASPALVESLYKKANTFQIGSQEFIESVKPLNLRYFTPKEVLSIMSFPKYYSFPEHITVKQCYRLLGNSVNVKVISELLKILYS